MTTNEMLNYILPFKENLLTQFYWVSIFLIGVAFFYFLIRFKKFKDLSTLPVLGKIAICMGLAYVSFLPCTVVGYLFQMPPWWMTLWYSLLLGATFVVAFLCWDQILKDCKKLISAMKQKKLFSIFAVVLLIILIELGINFIMGGYLNGDGVFHIGKVRHLATEGMNLTDFFYGAITDTGHTVTIVHVLYAIPATLGINIDPVASYATGIIFFNLLLWAVLGWLVCIIVNRLNPIKGSKKKNILIVAIVAIVILLSNSYFATYPSHVATTFIILLMIGIYYLFEKKIWQPLLLAAVAITFTHVLYAIIAILFLMFVCLVVLVFRKDRFTFFKKNIAVVIVCFAILAIMPIVTICLQKMTGISSSTMIEYGESAHWSIGPLYAVEPNWSIFFKVSWWPLVALSLIGLVTIFFCVKDTVLRIICACSLAFVPLTVWNPLVYPIMDRFVPEWVFRRFESVNFLAYTAPALGVVGLMILVKKLSVRYGWTHTNFNWTPALIVGIAMIILVIKRPLGRAIPNISLPQLQKRAYLSFMDLGESLPNDSNAVVLTDDIQKSFTLVAASNVKILAALPTSSPGDGPQRNKCLEYLNKTWDLRAMKGLGITYLMLSPGSNLELLANNDPVHAKKGLQTEYLGYLLYELNLDDIDEEAIEVCTFKEKKL